MYIYIYNTMYIHVILIWLYIYINIYQYMNIPEDSRYIPNIPILKRQYIPSISNAFAMIPRIFQ